MNRFVVTTWWIIGGVKVWGGLWVLAFLTCARDMSQPQVRAFAVCGYAGIVLVPAAIAVLGMKRKLPGTHLYNAPGFPVEPKALDGSRPS